MRELLFVFILIFILAGPVFSQTAGAKNTFAEATALAREGNFQEALEKYRAIAVPENDREFAARVHFNIGVCLYRLGQTENAVAEYQKAIKFNGRYRKAFYAAGMAYADLRRREKAREAFSAAIELDKSDGEAWFDLGMVLLAEKDYDSAREAFEHTVETKSASAADALNNIGVLAALAGDLPGAEMSFRKALAISGGGSPEAVKNLAFCAKFRRGEYKDLIAVLLFSREQNSGE